MANNDDSDFGEAFLPISKADTAMEVIDRMKQEEADVSFEQAMRLPTTRLDPTRMPGQVYPPVQPGALAPTTIRLPQVTPDPRFEALETARRFNLPVDTVLRAQEAQQRFEAQRRYQAAVESGDQNAMAKWGFAMFPSTGRGTSMFQPQYRSVPAGSSLVAATPWGSTTIKEGETPPRVHFGQRGEVLQEKGGVVTQIRPPEAREAKLSSAHVTIPADDFGPQISGPSDHPEILRRAQLKQQQEASDAAARKAESEKPGFLGRIFGGRPAAAPVVAPPRTATGTTAAPAAPANEVTRITKDGRRAVFDATTKRFLRYAD